MKRNGGWQTYQGRIEKVYIVLYCLAALSVYSPAFSFADFVRIECGHTIINNTNESIWVEIITDDGNEYEFLMTTEQCFDNFSIGLYWSSSGFDICAFGSITNTFYGCARNSTCLSWWGTVFNSVGPPTHNLDPFHDWCTQQNPPSPDTSANVISESEGGSAGCLINTLKIWPF